MQQKQKLTVLSVYFNCGLGGTAWKQFNYTKAQVMKTRN